MGLDTIRNLDLYNKVPSDLTQRTLSGALVSVACVITTLYLMFAELVLYTDGSLKTSIFVSYLNQETEIPVRFNATIVDKLCEDIAMDKRHQQGHVDITMMEMSINKVQVEDDCNLHGLLHIKKTAGLIIIIPHQGKNWTDIEYRIVPENHEKPVKTPKGFIPAPGYKPPDGYKVVEREKNMKMNHIIHEIEFGDQLPNTHRWEDVVPPEGTPFRALSEAAREYEMNLSHDYHLRLVPTTFIDQNRRRTDSYQYSYGYQNFIMATPAGIAPPSIILRYDISPMEIKYQYYRKPMYHLLTMMCAIVGGVVTVAGVIDKLLFSTHELVKKKMLLGKLS